MKIVLILSVILFLIRLENAYDIIPGCNYIDNQPHSVEINCNTNNYRKLKPNSNFSNCQNDLFLSSLKENHRSKVKRLEIADNSDCIDLDGIFPIDQLFGNIRELRCSTGSTSTLYSQLKFRYLTKFNASHGFLTSLSERNFQGQPNLQEIDFSDNLISNIDETTFKINTKLSIINLSHNALLTVDRRTFSNLRELRILDLSSNQIEEIDGFAFENNPKLEMLRLDMNPYPFRFDCKTFLSMIALRLNDAQPSHKTISVYVSLENVIELDLNCVKCSIKSSAENTKFVIKMPEIENDLHFSHEVLANLRSFKIGGKHLDNITNVLNLLGLVLEELDVSSNQLGEINANTFEKFKHLKQLKLSNTNLTIGDTNPFHHQRYLKSLDLSFNNLANVNFVVLFPTLQNLSEFSVGGSQIEDISKVLELLSPSLLTSLDVSFNRLGVIKEITFQKFTNLRFLNLSHTELNNFKFESFHQFSKLETLDLSYNNLTRVSTLRRFNNLIALYLGGNLLTTIDDIGSHRFPKLNTLEVSANRFSCEYLSAFRDLFHNEHIELIYRHMAGTQIDEKHFFCYQ